LFAGDGIEWEATIASLNAAFLWTSALSDMGADMTQWWTWDTKRYDGTDAAVGYARLGGLCNMANKASITEWGQDTHDSVFVSSVWLIYVKIEYFAYVDNILCYRNT